MAAASNRAFSLWLAHTSALVCRRSVVCWLLGVISRPGHVPCVSPERLTRLQPVLAALQCTRWGMECVLKTALNVWCTTCTASVGLVTNLLLNNHMLVSGAQRSLSCKHSIATASAVCACMQCRWSACGVGRTKDVDVQEQQPSLTCRVWAGILCCWGWLVPASGLLTWAMPCDSACEQQVWIHARVRSWVIGGCCPGVAHSCVDWLAQHNMTQGRAVQRTHVDSNAAVLVLLSCRSS